MINLILAITKQGGIGYRGTIPWHIPEDLKLFRETTMGSILIVGRKTMESLPKLDGRQLICVTRDKSIDVSKFKNKCFVSNTIQDAVGVANMLRKRNKIFVIGGVEIYNYFLENKKSINRIYISILKEEESVSYKCDTFVNFNFQDWVVRSVNEFESFNHYILHPKELFMVTLDSIVDINLGEQQYLKILREVYDNGYVNKGRNGETKSQFVKTLEFNLTEGFPLLTTKKMFFRGIVEELLFFIRGQTDTKILEEKKINIWRANTNREFLDSIGLNSYEEGQMGPMYGSQWRNFGAPVNKNGSTESLGVDQLKDVIIKLRNDKNSRRILLTTYNPSQTNLGVLPPCHSIVIQFYVEGDYLDAFCYNRSSDLFLGLPFNIASTALFIILIGKITNLQPRHFTLTLGNSHIYREHYDSVLKQIERIPYKFPNVNIKKEIKTLEDIEKLEYVDFGLNMYNHHPAIKTKMIA